MLDSRTAVGPVSLTRASTLATGTTCWRQTLVTLLVVSCALLSPALPTSLAGAGMKDEDLLKEPQEPAAKPAKKPATPAAKPASGSSKNAAAPKPAGAPAGSTSEATPSSENAPSNEPDSGPASSGESAGSGPQAEDFSSSMATVAAPTVASNASHLGVYSLEQFGPITTAEQAQAAFEKAGADISASGGGVLLVPLQTPADWQAITMPQRMLRLPEPPAPVKKWGTFPGVTVVDQRKPATYFPTQVTGWLFDRRLKAPMGWSPDPAQRGAMVTLHQQIVSGTSDVSVRALDAVPAGSGRKVPVVTIQGLVPGQVLHFGEGQNKGTLTVTALGFEQGGLGWHIVGDLSRNLSSHQVMECVTHVRTVAARTSSNNENQTFDTMIWKHSFGQGPSTLVKTSYKYMGDNLGAEGGQGTVLIRAQAESLTEPFEGVVESFDPANGSLIYKQGARQTHTLSSGRPIINLNPSKQIRVKAYVEKAPRRTTILEPEKLGQAQVGWWVTIDDPDGMYDFAPNGEVRCWSLITDIRMIDGKLSLGALGYYWGAKPGGAMGNYLDPNDPSKPREVTLIVAPGAMVNDASDGVQIPSMNVNNPKRLIRVVPHRGDTSPMSFQPGDPIQQAIAVAPWLPVIFRSWLFEKIPGIAPAPMFDVINEGAVQRGMVMHVHGTARYVNYFVVGTPEQGVVFNQDVPEGALILKARPEGAKSPFANGIVISSNHPNNVSIKTALVVNEQGQFVVQNSAQQGMNLKLQDVRQVAGLNSEAGNFRSIGVSVDAGKKSVTITFAKPESDAEYVINARPNWITNCAIRDKKPEGFTIVFDRPAGANATVDWLLVR